MGQHLRRAIAAGLVVAAAAAAGGVGSPAGTYAGAAQFSATGGELPTVGDALGAGIQTCAASRTNRTPTTEGECALWGEVAPVNVVIAARSASALATTWSDLGSIWRPAHGRWLVARGGLGPECGGGWRSTGRQIELRLNPASRRHLKIVSADCSGDGGFLVAFGTAHTDRYDRHRCHGDYMVDLDRARDDLVAGLLATHHALSVHYARSPMARTDYPGGCGSHVVTDGRVAYVVAA
ncbi:MAG TPA: hypothetical protein VI316_07130 [Candidatus Dormibacteraeota bacterium]